MAVSPDGATVYTANGRDNSVSRITNLTSTNPTVAHIQIGSSVDAVAVSPDGATLYAASPQTLHRITNLTAVTPTVSDISIGVQAKSLAVSPDGATVYTANPFSNTSTQITNLSSATPTVTSTGVGSYPYSVAVSPDGSGFYTADYSDNAVSRVSSTAAPAFTAAAPPAATAGSAYSYTFTASGSPAPTFSVAADDTLPAGLTLDATTGELSGTPTSSGTSTFRVVAKNSAGEVTSDLITFTVREKPVFTAVAPPAAEVGWAYSYTFTASGYPAPTFSVAQGDTLPAGLTLDATSGELLGTPAAAGTSTFQVVAENSAGQVTSDPITFIVQEGPAFTAAAPPVATVGTAYSYTFAASGTPAPTYSLAWGSTLPAGLSLNATTGELSGTPTAEGSSTFQIVAANLAGMETSNPITFTVQASPVFTAAAPPAAVAGSEYSYFFAASGYPAPTYSLETGDALPAGLTLYPATGELAGIPTTAGTSTFRLVATNAAGKVTSDLITFTVQDDPAFTAATPPAAVEGSAYSYTFAASGVPAPTFSLATGDALPAGLTLNATTGELSGTPTTAGTSTFRVVATNAAGSDTSDPITFIVQAPPVFTAAAPPAATVGTVYSYTFAATGTPAPTFSLATDDALPAGFTLDATTGQLTGTPTAAGSSTFRIVAANAVGTVTSDPITFVVRPAPAPSPSPTPSAVADSSAVSPAAALAVTGMAGVSVAFTLAVILVAAGIVVLFTRRRRRKNNNPTP
ncbi:putative Ig domain-containing protein [Microbacterium sp. 20-116]|uniref:putative Ig domain-containing protein n=1 Tax=Microbacterium sp. 20-116 TaxID=3239883 RepID=UPI0034E2874E